MSIFFFLKSLFFTPKFAAGWRVNAVRHGQIERADGYVLAHTPHGVLVEWPCGGTSLVDAAELALIG